MNKKLTYYLQTADWLLSGSRTSVANISDIIFHSERGRKLRVREEKEWGESVRRKSETVMKFRQNWRERSVVF